MTVSSKIRIYDLAKELKLDTKRLIEEVRREGVDVSVPSNSVSKDLAEKIRNKYFPKKEAAVKRTVKVVKRAARPVEEAPAAEVEEPVEAAEPEHVEAEEAPPPQEVPAAAIPGVAKPRPAAKLMKKLLRPRAEQPRNRLLRPPASRAHSEAEDLRKTSYQLAPKAPMPRLWPSNRQRQRRRYHIRSGSCPTAAALNAGIRPVSAPQPRCTPRHPKERAERSGALEIATLYQELNAWDTGRNCHTSQTTHIPPPDSGPATSRRTPARGGRKVEGKGPV